jgi:hypothetical protein
VAAICVLLLAGCGDEQSDQEARRAALQLEAEERKARIEALIKAKAEEVRRAKAGEPVPGAPEKFNEAEAGRYETDRLICSVLSTSEMTDDLELDSDSDPETIARAYSKRWPEEYRQASYEGCLAGIEKAEEG